MLMLIIPNIKYPRCRKFTSCADPNDTSIFLSNLVPEAMEDTAYNLDYEDYASGSFTAGGHSYVQPHAPRTIVEYPFGAGADEPSAKRKLLDYDANGNLLLVEQEISDPEDPLGKAKISLRENLWDEENRLLAVDLKPEAPSNKPEVAAYTYDASGERTIKYLPGRLDAYYSAKAAGSADRLESILYPSPLLTVKTLPLPEEMNEDELQRKSITKYTKHYYIGTERIASALGTMHNLGLLCENVWPGSQDIIDEMGTKTIDAGDVLIADYDAFEKELQLSEPFIYETYLLCVTGDHEPENYDAYWYHPDHLGSSSYITNLAGEVSQHMEYLPFGETLVEEHLNSYNSPYKFNAKELDSETGNYYYGARYYNPKWSIWLSVDPLAHKYLSYSPYSFVGGNPLNHLEVDGRWWFRKNTQSPYNNSSRYSYRMSNVRAVHSKQTSWASYVPVIGNILNASAMYQKIDDPSMSLGKGDIASIALGGYFKATRKIIKGFGALKDAAKTALDMSERSAKLLNQIANSPELKESWVELEVMRHFDGKESEKGNVIGYLRNDDEKSFNTSFEFSKDFISELNNTYGSEYDKLESGSYQGNRDEYINNRIENHLNGMFEGKKSEIMNEINK